MSAICGIIHLDNSPVPEYSLDRMMKALAYRGVDGSATWQKAGAALGHLRLHTTPESLGDRLPVYDANIGVALTSDARLDNREELFDELGIASGLRSGMPDSVLILRAYERWGGACPEHLLGDFAFAVWNGASRELILATDPMGIRTLFYYHTPQRFIFASEIKAILAVPGVERVINRKKIASLAVPALRHLEPESTFFDNIHVLPGSTVMRAGPKGLWRETYWHPDPYRHVHFSDEGQCAEAFREIFERAVSARLRSAFPVSSLYSGGLDSSAVTATAARVLGSKGRGLKAFSAVLPPGYHGTGTDERSYMDLLADHPGVDIEYICDPSRGPFDAVEELVAGGDRPAFASRHFLSSAFAEKAHRTGGRVLLSGVGGEFGATFHGDGYYAELLLDGRWPALAREIRLRAGREKRSAAGLVRSLVIAPLLPGFIIDRFRPRHDIDQIQKWMPLRVDFLEGVLGKEWKRLQALSISSVRTRPDHRTNQLSALSMGRRGKPGGGFVGHHRVEMTFPFMDKRILEFCLAAPGEMKVRNGYTRYLIRAAMGGMLPDGLRFRTDKNPFSPDFHDRYERQKHVALAYISRAGNNPLVNEVVDLDKLERMTAFTMQSNGCGTAIDFACMHAVPRGIYLISFLEQYGK